jgi:hypothetical protein
LIDLLKALRDHTVGARVDRVDERVVSPRRGAGEHFDITY